MEKISSRKRMEFLSNCLKFAFLLCAAILVIIPFLWMIVVSFERMANVQIPFPPTLLPQEFSLFQYELATENGRIFRAYFNSFVVTGSSIALNLIGATLAGYAFSKGTFPGKRLLFIAVLATMMIPIEARLIPLYMMFNTVGLLNTFWPLILPQLLFGFGVFLAKIFFDQLPNSLREAAQIDGAKEFKIFFRVFLPLTGPVLATMAILSFIWTWNDFIWPLVVLSSEHLFTVPIFLAFFSLENQTSLAGVTMALAALSVLPIIIAFLFLQRYIIQSVALSGLKGE